MTKTEALQSERSLKEFYRLEKLRDEAYASLKVIREGGKDTGPCGQGPFTGNTRESRQVEGAVIDFTPTQGGGRAVSLKLIDLYISAWDLGKYLESQLQRRIDLINAEMDKI